MDAAPHKWSSQVVLKLWFAELKRQVAPWALYLRLNIFLGGFRVQSSEVRAVETEGGDGCGARNARDEGAVAAETMCRELDRGWVLAGKKS